LAASLCSGAVFFPRRGIQPANGRPPFEASAYDLRTLATRAASANSVLCAASTMARYRAVADVLEWSKLQLGSERCGLEGPVSRASRERFRDASCTESGESEKPCKVEVEELQTADCGAERC
jgi:hypothetical protein